MQLCIIEGLIHMTCSDSSIIMDIETNVLSSYLLYLQEIQELLNMEVQNVSCPSPDTITAAASTSNSVGLSSVSTENDAAEFLTGNRSKPELHIPSNKELSRHARRDGGLHDPHSFTDHNGDKAIKHFSNSDNQRSIADLPPHLAILYDQFLKVSERARLIGACGSSLATCTDGYIDDSQVKFCIYYSSREVLSRSISQVHVMMLNPFLFRLGYG